MNNTIYLLIVFSLSVLIEMMVLPRILFISKRKRLYDIVDSRKVHHNDVSRLAGISFFPIILMVSLLVVNLIYIVFPESGVHILSGVLPSISMFIVGQLMIIFIGVKDDFVGSRYSHKLLFQFIASILLIIGGAYIENLQGLFGIYEIPYLLSCVLTVLFVAFFTNAMNLIDGIDGLAAAIGMLFFGVIGTLFLIQDNLLNAIIATSALGVLSVFIYYNLFSKHRKMFMGDTGSLSLGFLISYLTLCYISNENSVSVFPYPILIAGALLVVPMSDAIRVMIVRLFDHGMIFTPDREHIHHRLLDNGYSHYQAVIFLILYTVLVLLVNILLSYLVPITIIFLVDVAVVLAVNIYISYKHKNLNK